MIKKTTNYFEKKCKELQNSYGFEGTKIRLCEFKSNNKRLYQLEIIKIRNKKIKYLPNTKLLSKEFDSYINGIMDGLEFYDKTFY